MKSKKTNGKPDNGKLQDSGEEFFQLPRAEDLVEELQKDSSRKIGDLVANSAHRMEDRLTMEICDNTMEGADIRDGDYVVAEKKSVYPEGCILAVKLGSRELVRRYTRSAGRIQLQCDPPSRQTIIVEEHTPDFEILGQVVQVIRELK